MDVRALLAVAVLAGAPGARFPKGLTKMEPGPAPAYVGSWAAEGCMRCHAAAGAEWSASGHATARTSYVFQASIVHEDPAWCVRCHAPLARTETAFTSSTAADDAGVGCAACHAGSAHSSGERDLRDPKLCGSCHQFGFAIRGKSGKIERLAKEQQQDTLEEWRRWRDRTGDARVCVDCHMKNGDHSFGGTHRVESMRDALLVEVRDGALHLEPRDVGHEMPTGDVLRWISVETSGDVLFEESEIVARFGRTLLFAQRGDEPFPYLADATDTRLDGPVSIPLPPRAVAWRVVYHLVSEEQELDGTLPPSASRIVLHAGLTKGTP